MMTVMELEDGSEVLVSDKRFKLFSLCEDGEPEPSKFGLLLTDEIKKAVIDSTYREAQR